MQKYILSKMENVNFSVASNQLYLLTDYNKLQYPDYYKWYYGTNIPRIITGKGEIYFYLDAFIVAGMCVLKKTIDEKKICTLFINPEYRKIGLGKQILEDSFEFLETDKPIITIPENKIEQFKSIIQCYDWKQTSAINKYYSDEYAFNEINKPIQKHI